MLKNQLIVYDFSENLIFSVTLILLCRINGMFSNTQIEEN